MNKCYPIIKNFKSALAFALTLIFAFCAGNLFAQGPAQVNITVTISSPYSPFYSDYAGPNASKVLLLVQNLTATQKKIKLTGQLTGDNGIKISTKSNYVPLQPIILNANETKQLNGLALKDIFDLNTLNVYGIDKVKLVQTSRLPEGNYSFCIQAVDMNTNQVISTGAPLGCSTISIIYPDAPFLINPLSNNSIPAVSTVVFAWGNNVVLPMGIEYNLQVAEMPDVRTDPNQVLNATSFLLINKKILNSTSMVLSPSDPPLKKGKRYAWRVIATDPSGKIIFKNKGISRANEFRYGEAPAYMASTITLKTPEANRGIDDLSKLVFSWEFKDNWALNDNIGFYDGPLNVKGNNFGNSAKYELRIIKIKTEAEKLAERRAGIGRASGNSATAVDNGIVIPADKESVDYSASAAMAAYLKDGNDYGWSVKHVSTGVVSETRNLSIRVEEMKNRKLTLAGNLHYNFRDQYLAGAPKRAEIEKEKVPVGQTSKIILTEAEKGFPLANKSIQVLKVTLLAPTYKVVKKVKVKENGVDVTHTEETDSIAPLSNLLSTYAVNEAPKTSNTVAIASGTTDVNGNFEIKVPINADQFKVIDANPIPGKKLVLVEGLVIRVNDNRFSDPNWYIVPTEAGNTVALGESTIEAYSYKLAPELYANNANGATKGKLYLLKNETSTLKGEVENRLAEKKDVPVYKTIIQANGKTVVVGNALNSYTIVGLHNIDVPAYTKASQNIAGAAFANLVTSLSSNDDYTIYYEPNNEADALYYAPQKVGNANGKKNNYESTTWLESNTVEKVTFKPKFVSMQITGRYTYNWLKAYGKSNPLVPLPEGTKLNLVKGNLPQRSAGMDEPTFTDERLITSTIVKKNGEFTFDVGLVDYDSFNDKNTSDLTIVIDSKYYYAQSYSIQTNAQKNIKLPDLNATVRQFTYTNRIGYVDKSDKTAQTRFISNQQVYLCREINEDIDIDKPKNDGDPDRNYFTKIYELKDVNGKHVKNYEIIDKTISGNGGEFTFNRLITPLSGNLSNYHIFSEPLANSPENFGSIEDNIIKENIITGNSFNRNGKFGEEQKIVNIKYALDGLGLLLMPHIDVQPLTPYIDGAVYPKSNTSTTVLTNVQVEMFNMPVGSSATQTNLQYAVALAGVKPIKVDFTEANGRFRFDNADTPYGWKLLRFTKQGFITTYVAVNSGKPLPKGSRGNLQNVFMELPKDIFVTVQDANGQKVAARIIVGDDFSWMDYSPMAPANQNIAKSPKEEVTFQIIPVDRAKYKVTLVKATVNDNTSNLVFTVDKAQHILIVSCRAKGSNKTLENTVTVLNNSNYTQAKKYLLGKYSTQVNIDAGGSQFDLKVVPTDVNYTIAKTQVHSDGLNNVYVDVEVEPAVSIKVKGIEIFGNYDSKPLDGDFNAYVEGFDEDEYVISKSQVVVNSPPKVNEVIDVPNTNKAPKTVVPPPTPPIKKNEPVTPKNEPVVVPKTNKPIKTLKIGATKQSNTAEVASYLSAIDENTSRQGQNSNIDNAMPDGAKPSITNNYTSAFVPDYEQEALATNNEQFKNVFAETIVTLTISRLPANRTLTIAGSKPDYIGNTATTNPAGVNNTNVEIVFRKSPDVNVNTMYGFPIEVSQLYQSGGQYLISGKLKLAANSQTANIKSKPASEKLEFADVPVRINKAASGNPKDNYLTLVGEMVFEQNSIDAKLFNNYEVKVIDKNGLHLRPITTTTASLMGKVALDPSSLSKGVTASGSENEGITNYLYLNEKDKKYTEVFTIASAKTSSTFSTFSTAKSDLTAIEYWVSTPTGYLPKFTGPDGIIVVPDKNVLMVEGGILFNGTATTNLTKVATTNINAQGLFYLNNQGLYSYSQKPFSIKLRNWDLNVTSWEYGTTGFSAKGTLNALGLTIPFSNLNIAYNKIGFGNFDVKELKLLNTFPVKLNGSEVSVSFGFDKGFSDKAGAWSVSVLSKLANNQSIAGIKGLEDLDPADEIKIKNISLYDTGDENDTRILLNEDQAPVTINGIAKFRPGVMFGTSTNVKFRGDLNMEIPGFTGLEAVTYDLSYEAVGGQLKHIHNADNAFKNLGLDSKGMLVKFDNKGQLFNSKDGLQLKGFLTDKDYPDKYSIPVLLTKKLNTTTTLVTTTQNIYLNEQDKTSYLANASGKSQVNGSQWDYFTFGGNLTGPEGINPSPMKFIIKGEVVASSSELGVKNMQSTKASEGGLKTFSIVYDFKEGALIGSGHISRDVNFATLDLDAELRIGGSKGWYMFASGVASVANVPLLNNIGVGFMVGKSDITASQRSSFYKHFGGSIKLSPETESDFVSINGVLFMVSAEMKIPLLPTFDLNLDPVVHAEFKHGIYAATYFKLGFAGGPELTVGGRVGAYVKLGAGASIGLACAGVSLGAEAGSELRGNLNLSAKTFSAMMALNFKLEGSAYVGVGVCNSNCETVCAKVLGVKVCSPIKCYRSFYSKTLEIGVKAKIDNNGITLTEPQTNTEH